ncbi:methionyl-tRNA formyltransferase [Dethiosulfatibacter aminovorans DSM 17477]|uniref:Methionyl-tRNA formyltransferase n=1 Tax=Dethiosulfatibacter aminovorans DSM 17477 TaxID=1121476 RepID=A0A1M6DIV9_9FIRM|nr:methionyl-tRNA formyltransferase [Dethiosulfatibacter aminovorans]SHI73100.1 methionyl-tRNA formyltransferase [Dethiosulfatibacter aminovorans DSM 17477]
MSRIIYMGTPEFAVPALERIHNEGHEVVLVVTQPDKSKGRGKKILKTPVKESAEKLGLEIFQPDNINSEESMKVLKSYDVDFIVVTAYGQILKKEILEIPKFDCLNIHASLLPKYRGAAPINWAIINGEKKTGITIMKIEEGLDSGPMYLKKEMDLNEEITAGNLHDRLMVMGAEMIVEAIKGIADKRLVPEEQDHKMSSYASMLKKSMSLIDWNDKGLNIHNKIRGLDPWPGSVMIYKDKKVKIFNTEYIVENHDYDSGTIVSIDNTAIKVAVNDGYLIIKEIQFPGKRRMDIKTFLLGNEIEIGYELRGE